MTACASAVAALAVAALAVAALAAAACLRSCFWARERYTCSPGVRPGW